MKRFLLLIAILFTLFGCKSTQPLKQETVKETVKKEKDSLNKVTEINKEIVDSLAFKIPETKTANRNCDSLADVAVQNALRNINAKKQSGDNSYELKYNELKRQFELLIKVGQTKSTDQTNNKSTENSSSEVKTVEVPVLQPFTKEQTFDLWTGRIFWVLLTGYFIKKYLA